MTSQPNVRRTIRSVLVAIDDASSGHDIMEAAVSLAADLQAELQGLYIEDVNLLRMAELPFVYEVTTASGAIRPIDAQSLQKAMQQKAEQLAARWKIERNRRGCGFHFRSHKDMSCSGSCWLPRRMTSSSSVAAATPQLFGRQPVCVPRELRVPCWSCSTPPRTADKPSKRRWPPLRNMPGPWSFCFTVVIVTRSGN